jgi:agmatine deiminase
MKSEETFPADSPQTVYLPDTLFSRKAHVRFAAEFTGLLEQSGVPWQKLSGTRDIWARDYMPVEIAPRQFVQFRYWPTYVVKYPSKHRYITNGLPVFEQGMTPKRAY